MDKIAICVHGYNRVEKTRDCVESLLKYTKEIPFTLYLMDNGSETSDLVAYYETVPYENKKIIRIKKNVTGVYAVNVMFRDIIKAEYIVHVNNDIVLTENWLSNLMRCMESNEKIGAVVPVSTNMFYRQTEDLGGFSSLEEMQEKAKQFNQSNPDKWEEQLVLIPTATVYRTSALENVGFYDLGFVFDYGDNDIMIRIHRGGYKLMLCRDTFVHHNHYDSERSEEELMRRIQIGNIGKQFYIDKYGESLVYDGADVSLDEMLQNYPFQDQQDIKILFLNPRSGAQVFYMMNYLKAQHTTISEINVITEEDAYYEDFRMMHLPGQIQIGNTEELLFREPDGKYDLIIENGPVNFVFDTKSYIRGIDRKLKPGGICLERLENVFDFVTFISLLQGNNLEKEHHLTWITVEEIGKQIQEMHPVKTEVRARSHKIENMDAWHFVENAVEKMFPGEEKTEILNHLLIRYYFISYQKREER